MASLPILVAIVSVVYVFDVAAYPFIHIPLYVLTALYFFAVLEMYGLVRAGRALKRKLKS
jgi:hypothetical protein